MGRGKTLHTPSPLRGACRWWCLTPFLGLPLHLDIPSETAGVFSAYLNTRGAGCAADSRRTHCASVMGGDAGIQETEFLTDSVQRWFTAMVLTPFGLTQLHYLVRGRTADQRVEDCVTVMCSVKTCGRRFHPPFGEWNREFESLTGFELSTKPPLTRRRGEPAAPRAPA